MSDTIRFDDRVVVVTGAGGGLGRSHALEFAKRGAKVVINDLGGSTHGEGKGSEAADRVVAEIEALGGQAVANYDSVEDGESIIQTAIDNFDRIDIVINNAGILRDKSFAKMTDQDWDLIYKVHTLGAYKVSKAAWPHMQAQNYGRIINTSSAAGIYGNFGQANYSTAKLGLYGLTQTLAQEGAKYNIKANAIAPVAGSRMTQGILPEEALNALKPELITPVVVRLCAEHSQETSGLFELGAGWVTKLRWERTEGYCFAPNPTVMSVEAVDEAWAQITDFSVSTHPAGVQDSFGPIFKNLGIKV